MSWAPKSCSLEGRAAFPQGSHLTTLQFLAPGHSVPSYQYMVAFLHHVPAVFVSLLRSSDLSGPDPWAKPPTIPKEGFSVCFIFPQHLVLSHGKHQDISLRQNKRSRDNFICLPESYCFPQSQGSGCPEAYFVPIGKLACKIHIKYSPAVSIAIFQMCFHLLCFF